jgi:hypothetical protein
MAIYRREAWQGATAHQFVFRQGDGTAHFQGDALKSYRVFLHLVAAFLYGFLSE